MQEKFSAVSVSESNGWSLPLADEGVLAVKTVSKALHVNQGNKGNRNRLGSAPSEGLKELIVQRRRKMQTDKVVEVHVEKCEKTESKAAQLSPPPLKTFDGGFFTLSSPAACLLENARRRCQTARSVGRKQTVNR